MAKKKNGSPTPRKKAYKPQPSQIGQPQQQINLTELIRSANTESLVAMKHVIEIELDIRTNNKTTFTGVDDVQQKQIVDTETIDLS